ncbi:hypothetical protein PIB30_067147 [Stylosanthes scabra]|uniref:Uncharacterized protein n=1 Tax=Stylosanthes scabra TaxID=79078 RepID=A0ABU6YMU9_9FABA|nr:hypothetical protein [Stylosanthes scabra]
MAEFRIRDETGQRSTSRRRWHSPEATKPDDEASQVQRKASRVIQCPGKGLTTSVECTQPIPIIKSGAASTVKPGSLKSRGSNSTAAPRLPLLSRTKKPQ